jgi:hypothetical protein
MNICQGNFNPLLGRDIHTSYSRHWSLLLCIAGNSYSVRLSCYLLIIREIRLSYAKNPAL